MTNRQQLRHQLRHLRQQITVAKKRIASEMLVKQVTHLPIFQNANHIACYLSNDNEIDPYPILELAWSLGKHCYLPVLNTSPENKLTFMSYHKNDSLNLNRYKIPEPLPEKSQVKHPEELDIIFIPLVGFDIKGNRLGMGAGYYDRTLESLKTGAHIKKPYLIGLAYELQRVAAIPCESWDVALDIIITEQNIYKIGAL